jgi:NADH-quinone oxidoreductase subunit D/NADH-quinone oxidoreductase subunit C/D
MTDQLAPDLTQLDLDTTISILKEKFPQAISLDSRSGYSGIVVDKDKLIEVAQVIRDEMGFDYLSSATAVDYLGIEEGDPLEMVYHAYRTSGGSALVFKTKTDREEAKVPSLTSIYPGANFQEREAYDLFGIQFEGHPNLRRILLWEGFDGFPMRKDWKEAYYEAEHKPFDSRWPAGHVYRAEELNAYGSNVRYPADFDLSKLTDTSEEQIYSGMGLGVDVEEMPSNDHIKTDQLVVNMGPHHPSTHGVFRIVLTLDGETVDKLEPVMGYLHRNHEKIGERNTYLHNMPFTDRLDYISSSGNNFGYTLAVEHLLSNGSRYVPPTYRTQVIRVLMAELTRIVNHFWAIGFLLNDLGAFFTPALYAIAEREKILDFFEATTGARMMCNYFRFSGLAYDSARPYP